MNNERLNNHEQAEGAQGEREAFAAYLADCEEHAIVPDVSGAFNFAWQARAALAQPSPAPEHPLLSCLRENGEAIAEAAIERQRASVAPDLERPEVMAVLVLGGMFDDRELGDNDIVTVNPAIERLQAALVTDDEVLVELMTVAQHNRIVGALRAEIKDADGLSKMLGDLLREIDITTRGPESELTRYGYPNLPQRVKTLVDERNADQARIAELESQLLDASSERNAMQRHRDNEKRLFKRECDDADELVRLMGFDPEQYRTDSGSINLPKLRAVAAQAGQVPDEWRNALQRLESACDKRAELTSNEAYHLASQASGMRDALLELDNARLVARQLLAAAPAQGGE